MKSKIVTFIAIGILFLFGTACSTTKVPNENKNELAKTINSMQKLIGFNDKQASELKKVEFEYLKQVESIKKNTKSEVLNEKLIELKEEYETKIKNILTREQYLKYNAIKKNQLKNSDLIAN